MSLDIPRRRLGFAERPLCPPALLEASPTKLGNAIPLGLANQNGTCLWITNMLKQLIVFSSLLVACGPGVDLPLGGRDVSVSIVDCDEPKRGWAVDEVAYFGWHVVEAGEVSVQCAELDGAAGEYRLGTNRVFIDPTRVTDSFSTRAVTGHELTHWLIDHGPHPEFATLHVCTWPVNDPAPPGCYPGVTASKALMSPSGPMDWDGDAETFSLSSVPEYRVTEADRIFITAALAP